MVTQEIPVTAEQAEIAYQLALNKGPTAGLFCTHATSGILTQVPEFKGVNQTFFPENLQAQIERLFQNAETNVYYEATDGDTTDGPRPPV